MKNKLWIFSSYIPSIDTTRRTTNFTGANPGPRTLTQTMTTHNAYNRLDYGVTNTLRLFGSWNYGYFRQTGTLGGQDSNIPGQRNTGATTDPNTLRSDAGSVNPLSVYSFGGDWTPTAKLVVSARYGYFFNNTEQRGTPVGTRYVYQNSVNATTTDLTGALCPAPCSTRPGFANIPSNLATAYDAYKRKGFNVDVSYFVATWRAPTPSRAGTSTRRSPTTFCVPSTAARSTCSWEQGLHAGHQHHGLRRHQRAEPVATTASRPARASTATSWSAPASSTPAAPARPRRRSTSRIPGRWDTA